MIVIRMLLVLALATRATATWAGPAAAQAEALFEQGRNLMAANRFAEACAAFEDSQKLDPAVTTLLNLAGCRQANGQIATAWGLFVDAERQTRSATGAAQVQLHAVAQHKADQLAAHVSRLAIHVPDSAAAAGAEIFRDRDAVDPQEWNHDLPIDGGTHTISVRVHGASSWSTNIQVGTEDDHQTIDIPVSALQPSAAAPVATISEHAAVDDDHRHLALWLGGGAIVLAGAGVGASLCVDSTYSAAKAEMTSQARRDSLYASANHERYLAEGLGVAAIGCAAVAVWQYLRERNAEAPHVARRSIVVSPLGVAISGAW